MANNLNEIVQVNIDIAQPAVDSANFEKRLLKGQQSRYLRLRERFNEIHEKEIC